jgi:hypothetical protein
VANDNFKSDRSGGLTMLVFGSSADAQEVTKEQIKGLDEQIQEIKTDVLGIAAELHRLEEKLLYPSDTQVAVFVSLASGENSASIRSRSSWAASR